MIAEGDQQAGKVLSISEFTMNRKEKPYPKHQEAIMNLRQVYETLKSISGPPSVPFQPWQLSQFINTHSGGKDGILFAWANGY